MTFDRTFANQSRNLNKFREPVTREINKALATKVATGSMDARNEMIERNIPLVVTKVDSYLKKNHQYKHLHDDLVSAGIEGLINAIDRIVSLGSQFDIAGTTSYLNSSIRNELASFAIEFSNSVSASDRTVCRGQDIPSQVDTFETMSESIADYRSTIDLQDEIDICCLSDADRAIIKMRVEGYTDQEIAERLNESHSVIYHKRRAIYKRFLERTGLSGEV